MIKIKVESKDLDELGGGIRVLISNLGKLESELHKSTGEIAEAVGTYLWTKILEEHPKHEFMADRTRFQVVPHPKGAAIRIYGIKENDDKINMWNLFEAGHEDGGVQGKLMRIEKEGGDIRFVTSRAGISVTKYQGEVQSIVQSASLQVHNLVQGLLAAKSADIVAKQINKAFQGKIRHAPAARKLLAKAGVSDSMLAQAGIAQTFINPLTGAIAFRDAATGRFIARPSSIPSLRVK